jgi:hypothetical protein
VSRTLRRRLAAIGVVTLLLAIGWVMKPSHAAAQTTRCSSIVYFYGVNYRACITLSDSGNVFEAAGTASAAAGTQFRYTNLRLAVRILSNGNRVDGRICDVTGPVNGGGGTNCIIDTPSGHTGNTVQALAWVGFDRRCRTTEPPSCIGYHSSHPGVTSPGIISS